MKTIHVQYDNPPKEPASVCALGFFDGLHRGHAALVEKAVSDAKKKHLQSAVMTFDPDPWVLFHPGKNLDHLTSLEDKKAMLAAMGVDLFYIAEFSREFAALPVQDFHDFLRSLSIEEVVCGFDYGYGSHHAGNTDTLSADSRFETVVMPAVLLEGNKISSSIIEKEVEKGNVSLAADMLGYYYSMPGVIVSGYQRGRKMNFPTANLKPEEGYIWPAGGVYAGYVLAGQSLMPAMINIGSNPTFENRHPSVEAHILTDQELSLYNLPVRFFFVSRFRDEKKFDSIAALEAQLTQDTNTAASELEAHKGLLENTLRRFALDETAMTLSAALLKQAQQ